jgi:hypothetical protein
VLIFAILPPLQQFGLITGLTIIYAFFGSVFILPSLLVVWTKYAGPEWAKAQIRADGGDDAAGAVATSDAAGESEPAVNGHGSVATVRRTVTHGHVRPGQEITVEVAVDSASGRVGIRERFDGATVSVDAVSPEPASVAEHGRTVFAVWSLDDRPASVTYTATIPDTAADGETYTFEGTVMTAGEDVAVVGDEAVRVVTDLFERVLARGEVTDDDLAAAEERLAAGELTETQFERIYRTWLGEDDALTAAQTPGED